MASAAARGCPRCGTLLAAGQEYCLECGLRAPGPGRLGRVPEEGRRAWPGALALLLVALAGGGAAIALTWDEAEPPRVLTLTGGSATAPAPPARPGQLTAWPAGRDGWTIVLVSLPKTAGREPALARAAQARARGLSQVGILDSSQVASLHPGYWIVFAGVYETEPEATSALQKARAVFRTARPQRVVT
jgi:hypothetical protein